jgi:hypothetical protein
MIDASLSAHQKIMEMLPKLLLGDLQERYNSDQDVLGRKI